MNLLQFSADAPSIHDGVGVPRRAWRKVIVNRHGEVLAAVESL